MRHRYAVLGVVALLAACAPQQAVSQGDYPSYSSLAELCGAATLVVTGSPVGSEVRSMDLRTDDQGDTPQENPALGAEDSRPQDDVFVVTVTSFEVDDVIAGRAIDPGERIEVGQMGGELDGVEHAATQFPLDEGGTYLLFLMEFDDAPAVLLNPTEAGYVITADGTLEATSGSALGDELDGRTAGSDLCG